MIVAQDIRPHGGEQGIEVFRVSSRVPLLRRRAVVLAVLVLLSRGQRSSAPGMRSRRKPPTSTLNGKPPASASAMPTSVRVSPNHVDIETCVALDASWCDEPACLLTATRGDEQTEAFSTLARDANVLGLARERVPWTS